MRKKHYETLRLILWDHLSDEIASLRGADPKKDHLLFLETVREATYVPHHKKKLVFLLSALRSFAETCKERGFSLTYIAIDQQEASLTSGIGTALRQLSCKKIIVTEPGEYRIRQEIESWEKVYQIPVEIRPDDRFFLSQEDFSRWARGKKTLRMENLYRNLRKETGLLMDGAGKPFGEKWNFDRENRNPLRESVAFPPPYQTKNTSITKSAIRDVKHYFPDHFGESEPFWYATTRREAQRVFSHFLSETLPSFGPFQDAMLSEEAFLFHSVISLYLNVGLLLPKEVCRAVDAAYREGRVPIQSAEGFLRQILGWREYVRGIYWWKMPDYAAMNFLQAKRPLPSFYWTGETKMNCVKQVVRQTAEHAYSHHIQRLMITGNFALLMGALPEEVCEWYLSVYADAHEWVELPNTLGMSQYADGGLLGTKPYASSGSYIDKMSNFCEGCAYDVHRKEGEGACPFNYLYWDFLLRHEKKLAKNPRLAMPYRTLSRFSEEKKEQIRDDAKNFLQSLEDTS